MSLPQRRVFRREGLDLAWYDTGGDGVPVLFQHGLGGDAGQALEAFPPGPDWRLITLECRGHGGSAAGDPAHSSIATFADDTAALLDALGLGPIVVGGISMGAAIATRLAVKRPDCVRALALVRPAWIAGAAPANMAPNDDVGRLLARLPPEAAEVAFKDSETYRYLAVHSPDNLLSLLGFFRRQPIETTAALLVAIAGDGPGIAEDELRRLDVPTLVVGTSDDAIHPWAMAEQLAGLIPRATLVKVRSKGAGKAGYLEDLHGALGAFLKEL